MKRIFALTFFTAFLLFGCKKADKNEAPTPIVSLTEFKSNLVGTWKIGATSTRYSAENAKYEVVSNYKYKLLFEASGRLTMIDVNSNLAMFYNSYVVKQDENKVVLTFFDDSGVSRDCVLLTYTDNLFTTDMTANYNPAFTGSISIGANDSFYIYNKEVFHYSFSKEK